ncbi:DNA excision repair protein ERCC-5 [Anoplolepis gracilipes]|uniref:DNA excision repair protein ERCC-5 n=1 Tax=Anoplolepis gracilipes TaxID=354296 RepID=UPI003BA3AA22
MGVYGLWKLLETSGKPVPLESLEGKVLAIDISIWMYQVLQGYQDRHGAPKPNAHLLGLFTRICKLLYYKIKPVFVFDGGVPMLKKNTIALRRKQKSIATSKAQKMKADLINNLIKHSVVKTVLNKDSKVDEINGAMQTMINIPTNSTKEDMFILPDIPSTSNMQTYISDSEDDSDTSVELSPRKQSKWMGNIHNVDVTSNEFKALPADVRYDILTDLKETRKQNSWGRLHEIPQESQEFSGYQLTRLLKRRYVQESLESAEKEMGGKTLTLEELDKLLTEQGINTKGKDMAFRIAADSTTRLIYISDKNTLAKNSNKSDDTLQNVDEKIESIAGPSNCTPIVEDINEYELSDMLQNVNEKVESIAGPSNCASIVEDKSEYELNDTLQNVNEKVESIAGPSNYMPIVEDINEYELNDSDDDINVPIHEDFSFITNDINENTFDSDKESEIDMNESLAPLDKKYLNKNTNRTNPALAYLLEHSGLSQKQIIHLMKYNKNQSHKTKSTSKNIKIHEKNTNSELTKDKNSAITKSVLPENYIEVSKSTESHNMENACTTNDNMTVKLISSNMESDNFTKEDPLKHNVEVLDVTSNVTSSVDKSMKTEERSSSPAKSNDNMSVELISTVRTDTSDSDSDDFIEIQDTPIPYTEIVQKNITNKKSVEITFKSDEKLEDDIFADIFEKADKNEDLPTSCLKQIQSVNENEDRMPLISKDNNLKSNLLNTTPEELIIEKTEINKSPENTQLIENKSNDENKVHTSQDSNNLIEHNNVDLQEKKAVLPTNEEDLIELKEQLEYEQEELTKDIGKFERQATNISDQIQTEAQELLRLFGIPYIVAPMEAEAQCAYLEQIKLTDGTITDDSDIWLFGGQYVYKNFFNNNRRVLQFRACDIQHHFKLSRNQLIQLALLVGSDYTTGVAGVGPVTALEILAAFPPEGDNVLHGLYNFCSWIKEGKPSRKMGLHNKLQNIKLDRDFPSQAVVQAYLFPTVDESKETFTWGKPNVVFLCDYTRQKFGWTKGKFDDTMIPVLKKMAESRSQKLLDMYFKTKTLPLSIEPTLSKRVQKALYRLNNVDMDEKNVDGKSQSKRSKKSDTGKLNQEDKEVEEDAVDFEITTQETKPLSKINAATTSKIIKSNVQRKSTKEYIPQREKDKKCALERKLYAIEIFRKSKQGLDKTRKVKRAIRKVKKEAELSESDSD